MSDQQETVRIKIGPHEFEATGSPESVREKFESFKELVRTLAGTTVKSALDATKQVLEKADEFLTGADELTKIMQVSGREVSLTARPQNLTDAILVIILGQKILRQNDAVTGAEIISGLEKSGGYSFNRVDGILDKIARDGDLLTFGERRGKKYRLTNTGLAKARSIAAELISSAA
jgi:hypothetical protein